jgi:palmitoyl-protein thioesterase
LWSNWADVPVQGGEFLRAVAQRCPSPPMRNMVTLASQHQGIFGFPGCPGESVELCNVVREMLSYGAYTDNVQETVVPAQVLKPLRETCP